VPAGRRDRLHEPAPIARQPAAREPDFESRQPRRAQGRAQCKGVTHADQCVYTNAPEWSLLAYAFDERRMVFDRPRVNPGARWAIAGKLFERLRVAPARNLQCGATRGEVSVGKQVDGARPQVRAQGRMGSSAGARAQDQNVWAFRSHSSKKPSGHGRARRAKGRMRAVARRFAQLDRLPLILPPP
jgi:hypothetical protein